MAIARERGLPYRVNAQLSLVPTLNAHYSIRLHGQSFKTIAALHIDTIVFRFQQVKILLLTQAFFPGLFYVFNIKINRLIFMPLTGWQYEIQNTEEEEET